MSRLREVLESFRYESSVGLGQRGLGKHHIDALEQHLEAHGILLRDDWRLKDLLAVAHNAVSRYERQCWCTLGTKMNSLKEAVARFNA